MTHKIGEDEKKALAYLESNWDVYLEMLNDLVRIPSISERPAPDKDTRRCAETVVRFMAEAGMQNCEVIEFSSGHPYACGEWLGAPGKPTVLLYAHHDVQPPGRLDKWETPAFEPTVREDGRLYGRGTADDKAGVMLHIASCAAWLKAVGRLPLNVKIIIEGEEESGSPSLEAFMGAHKDRISADYIVIADSANLATGLPSITTSLRGNVGCMVDVRSIASPIHSGLWGGPVPDPVMALNKAVAELVDEYGRPSFKGALDGVRELSAEEKDALERLPFDEAKMREDVGMVQGATLTGDPEIAPWGRIFRQPTLTVIAFESRSMDSATNQIIESARCMVSMRIVPDQNPEVILDALMRHFEERVPWGLEVKVKPRGASSPWMTDTSDPAFGATKRALAKGYNQEPVIIGCGGSIPLVEPFARVLGNIPVVLVGVEDPRCKAHGENESLDIGDWKSGVRSGVHLYEELGALNPA